MNIKNLIENFKSIKEEDVVDFGEDYDGNPLFLIKNISSSLSLLTINKFDPTDVE